ncbi:MAG: pyridoxamine 5'-phosphate oxidase family protein [Byssovorax sp.]
MGSVFTALDDKLTSFVRAQHLFFVATAPSGDEGHVNLSPKGYDTFRVLDETTVVYLDLTGSGVETIAHLQQNGRITLMFCAFSGPPNIVRLYGRGEVVLPTEEGFAELAALFDSLPGIRSVIRVRLDRVATSCGYGIPRFDYEGDRDTLIKYAEKKGPEGMARYQREKNARSIDGIPGLEAGASPLEADQRARQE